MIATPPTLALHNRPRRVIASSSQNSLRNEAQGLTSSSDHVWNALHELGYDSLPPVLDCLLKSASISTADCRQMLLMLLKCKEIREELVIKEDQKLCEELSCYTSSVIDQEMKALVLHPTLRLPTNNVNPKTLEQFDLNIIADEQQKCAPVLTSMLYTCAGLNGPAASDNIDRDETDNLVVEPELGDETSKWSESRGRNRKQIATVSLCMLCYSRNQQSNVLQMTAGYFAFADNASKRMVEIFH